MTTEKTEYLCEIAFMYWASDAYSRYLSKIPEEWIDYDKRIKLYDSIYQTALKKDEDQSLIQSIYDIMYNSFIMDELFEKFLSSVVK